MKREVVEAIVAGLRARGDVEVFYAEARGGAWMLMVRELPAVSAKGGRPILRESRDPVRRQHLRRVRRP